MVQNTVSTAANSGRGTMTANRFRINLGKDAVKLALDGEWARAAELNRAILKLCPEDCEAANRLAKALMELADYTAARTVLDDIRARHPNNNIARKNLARLEKLELAGPARPSATAHATGMPPLFIEEGGKSCTTTLRRIGDASDLADIVGGDTITLTISADAVIAHSADGKRLGTVEPRLARRLRKLMDGGNRYSVAVISISGDAVVIVIRETQQHPSLRNVVSFPPFLRNDGVPDGADSDSSSDEVAESAENPNSIVDPSGEPEQEDALPTLATDEIDDDESTDDAGVGVPVLDTDDVDSDPILEIVPPQEDDWE